MKIAERRQKNVNMYLLLILTALIVTSCSGFQRTNESVVLSDNRGADNTFPVDNFLNYLLYKQNVTVAVLAGRIIRMNDNYAQDEEWINSIRMSKVDELERHLHDMATYYSRYSLIVVDRQNINKIIVDFDTSNLTRVPKVLREELARQAGTTHVLLLNFTQNYDGRSHTIDTTNRLLINVATGSVEAADVLEERNPASKF
jgi:hypothetical protein